MDRVRFTQNLVTSLRAAPFAPAGRPAMASSPADRVTLAAPSTAPTASQTPPADAGRALIDALAPLQTELGTRGMPMLVALAGRVGRDMVTVQQEGLWARRTAFENATFDSAVNPRLEQICKRLGAVSSVPELKLSPVLEERTGINAKAAGAGFINVTQGLVSLIDDASAGRVPSDEKRAALTARVGDYMRQHAIEPDGLLAAFVAHEIGHVEHRDVAANWGQQMLGEQLRGMASGFDVNESGPARVLLAHLPGSLRDENWATEFKADRRGAELLDKAGYPRQNVAHMLEVLRIVEDVYQKPRTDDEHPPLLDRIAQLPPRYRVG